MMGWIAIPLDARSLDRTDKEAITQRFPAQTLTYRGDDGRSVFAFEHFLET